MSVQQEQRKYPRMSVSDAEYGVRFQVGGLAIREGRLVNLSAGGCGIEVAITDVWLLDVGDVLEDFHVDHPDLPAVPLSALVMRMLGKVPGKTSGYVLVGVEFQRITPFVRNLIADHVSARMGPE
ncbi:MAG: PilZ domain-containing protein [Holophagaceae bacterium]|uniref:PilZ domain-containing protein n=1 Tax=Candidatus Geothrix skivensis TaxID=2954439 RepID=A0A9D7SG33_9BACT|nr:PilZ domain-containing protein [Candidatus Geothrix skivensis]